MLKVKVKHLEARAEDAKNRNRRNNLGLPEGAEGNDPISFMESLLHTLLPQASFSPQFAVERAHGIPRQRPSGGTPVHPHI